MVAFTNRIYANTVKNEETTYENPGRITTETQLANLVNKLLD